MITIHEALEIVRSHLPPRSVEEADLPRAAGRALAGDILAREPSPRFTNSAMDGFAVRWEDVKTVAASAPVRLKIVGESRAGAPFAGRLESGQAARISTGGMLCRGADTVIPLEETEVDGEALRVLKAERAGNHLRREGEEFKAGELLLRQGAVLNPPRLALLASQGIVKAPVYRRPGVAVIVTGTELVPYHAPAESWQIRDSNGVMLRSAIEKSGGEVTFSARVGDRLDETLEAVRRAAQQADIILFSGGVSVGPHDLVKSAAQQGGFETLFWRVKQRPGKPLFFARRSDSLFFGLPGNPVSAYMCYLFYVQPVLAHLQGKPFGHESFEGEAAAPIFNSANRAQLYRVALEGRPGRPPLVYPLARQGSHMLTSLTAADGFIHLEENVRLESGTPVEVIPFT